MRNENEIKLIMDGIVWDYSPKHPVGGQTCGTRIIGWELSHPDFQIKIFCRDFRSSTENRKMCLTLFELFLMEFMK